MPIMDGLAVGSGQRVVPEDLVRMPAWVDGRRVLSDGDGESCRLAEYAQRPQGDSLGLQSDTEGEADVRLAISSVFDVYDWHDVRWKDVVAGFMVEAQRLVGRDDGQHDASVVVCCPGVAVELDLQSDAFAPVCGVDGDALGDGYQAADHLCAVVAGQGVVAGVLFVWHDEGACYEAVLGPRPYERRPERVIEVDARLWETLIPAVCDLFGQQAPDFLCLHLRFDGPDDQAAGWMCRMSGTGRVREWIMAGSPSADEVLERFEQVHGVSPYADGARAGRGGRAPCPADK